MNTTDCPAGCDCLCDPCVIFGTAGHHNSKSTAQPVDPERARYAAERQRFDDEWLRVDKRRRDQLLAFDERWCLGLHECVDRADLAAMSTRDIQLSVTVSAERCSEYLAFHANGGWETC